MIQNHQDYNQLANMADTAEDCLQSLRFGSHAALMRILYVKYGIRTDRTGAIKEARRLCAEYIMAVAYELKAEEA